MAGAGGQREGNDRVEWETVVLLVRQDPDPPADDVSVAPVKKASHVIPSFHQTILVI